MENSGPVILIPDEESEAGFGETIRGGQHGVGGENEEDQDWLSNVLKEFERNAADGLSIIDAISDIQGSKLVPTTLDASKKISDSDDDECVILENDPNKPLVAEGGSMKNDDADDLVVISEKGQVACRDFPHPRHLCAKFLYASTPHEMYCDQCHCYVCDSIAPCALWGTGILSLDHCHATEKDEFWRAQRESMKKSNNLLPVVPSVQSTSFSTGACQNIQVPPFFLPTSPSARQVTAGPCTMITNNINVYIINQSSSQPPQVSQQLNTANGNGTWNARNHSSGSRGPRFTLSRAVFKRAGSFGVSLNISNRSKTTGGPFVKNGTASPNLRPTSYISMGIQAGNSVYNPPQVSVSPNIGGFHQPQMASQPYSSSLVVNSTLPQLQISSQTILSTNPPATMPLQSQVVSQSNGGNNSQLSFHPNGVSPSQTLVSQSVVISQPSMVNAYEIPSSSQPNSDPTSISNGGHIPNTISTSCGSNWGASFRHCNLFLPAGSFQHQHSAPTDNGQQQMLIMDNESYHQSKQHDPFSANTNLDSLDFLLDSWVSENQSSSGALATPVTPEINVFSPDNKGTLV